MQLSPRQLTARQLKRITNDNCDGLKMKYTLSYVPVEDRMRLVFELPSGPMHLWLTRKLWAALCFRLQRRDTLPEAVFEQPTPTAAVTDKDSQKSFTTAETIGAGPATAKMAIGPSHATENEEPGVIVALARGAGAVKTPEGIRLTFVIPDDTPLGSGRTIRIDLPMNQAAGFSNNLLEQARLAEWDLETALHRLAKKAEVTAPRPPGATLN